MSSEPESNDPVGRLVEDVSGWKNVEAGPHRFNAVEFTFGGHEIGHVHRGGGTLDINYPKRMRDTLIAEGRTGEHHFVPNSGWTTYRIRSVDDVPNGHWLLRVSYLYRALTRRNKPEGREVLDEVDVAAELDELAVSEAVRAIFENVTELEGRRPAAG